MENLHIGHIIKAEGNEFTVRLLSDDEGYNPVISTSSSSTVVGQIGSHVSIRQSGVHILASVTSTWESSDEDKTSRFLTCMPLGEITENNQFSRGINHYPISGAETWQVTEAELQSLFSSNADYGFSMGHLSKHSDVQVYMDPNPLFGRHLAILGQSGAGKSWTVTSLLQNTVKTMPNAHIVLLDLHGEYCWRNENNKLKGAFSPSVMRYVDARDLEIPYWLLTYSELIDLLIDRNDPGASIQIAFLREVLLTLRKQANQDLVFDRLSVDSPVYFSIEDLLLHFKKANEQQTDFGKTKGALFGQFDEFLVKLQSKLNDARYDFLFRPKRRKNSDSLEGLLRDFTGLTDPKRQITVIDLSPVPSDVRPVVAAQLGKLAFEFNYWNPKRKKFPIQLVCEEAHAYITRDHDEKYKGTRIAMERIAKEGRKYGVGLTVVSQRPYELSETVLSQCSNYICMRLTNPDDQQYVRSLVPEGQSDLVSILSALGRGEALALGEAIPLPTRFQVDAPFPTPNSHDADFYNEWSGETFDVDVADIVNRWRKQIR
jgi:DNA helicase HerA-like ATPase